ncbi:MAG: LysE family translocator [Alphaproteobacteria bacterium]|nr:LysE family translocator [Alphaproteobacteria bacterium]
MVDQILVVAGLTFLVMLSPGPDIVIVMRNTIVGGGRAAGLNTSSGILLGNLVHITYCAVGIGWLISESALAFTILRYAGAAYLIYIGLISLRSAAMPAGPQPAQAGTAGRSWFVQGFINNILNVKEALFYLGVFTVVITPGTSISAMLVLIVVMMAISGSFWLCFVYALDSHLVRNALESSQRVVNVVFGALLIALGARVAVIEP